MEKTVYTTCTRDCPDNCGIFALVRDGRVIKLSGHPQHEYTQGFLCEKSKRFIDRVYSPDRQLYPLRRKNNQINGEWERVDWDEALDLVAEQISHRIKKQGPLSIMHYQRTGSWGVIKQLSRRFWNLLGGVTINSGSLCAGAARAGQISDFGSRVGNDPLDLLNSKFVIVWGRNPVKTSVHLVPILKKMKKRNGTLVLIDPVHSETAEIADYHVQPLAGTDAELAMAMAKVILEEGLEDRTFIEQYTKGFAEYLEILEAHPLEKLCQTCELSEPIVRDLARSYASNKPAAIVLGWGLNKYKNSAETFRLIDALAALCGNIGVSGGGSNHGYDTKRHIDKTIEIPNPSINKRTIPEPLMGRGIIEAKEPPIHMMFINGCNPVNQSPNSNLVAQALAGLDFVVVVDQFLNDTTDYAHVFLPSTTFLEEDADIVVSWGHNFLGGVNKVIEPLGEARSDFWIIQQLSERMGLGVEMAGTEVLWLKRMFSPLEKMGVTTEQVLAGPVRCPVAPMVSYADHLFKTESGKFEFITDVKHQMNVMPDFPLRLITSMSKDRIISQLTEKEHPKEITAKIGEGTANEYGIVNEEKVRISSSVGSLEVKILIDPRVGRSIVVMPVGTWIKRGGGPNILTEDIMSNYGQMAAFYETRVQIQRLGSLN